MNRMKVFLIGFGYMGRLHARVLSKMNLLGGIIDISKDLREMASELYSVPIYSSIDEAVSDAQIESAIIAVPTPFHNRVIMELVDKIPAIKSLLIEKPMVASLDEYYDNKDFWQSIAHKCIVGHIEVYNPVVTKFVEIVNSDEYGVVRSISIERKSAVQHSRLDSLAGVVEDVGIHDLDLIIRLLPGSLSVYAVGLKFNNKLNSTIAIIKNDNSQAVLQFSREFSGRKRIVTVELEKATIYVDLVAQTIEIRGLGEVIGENNLVTVPHGPGSSIKVYGEPLQEEILNLIGIAEGKNKPKVSIENGHKALRLADAIINSIKDNKIVEIE